MQQPTTTARSRQRQRPNPGPAADPSRRPPTPRVMPGEPARMADLRRVGDPGECLPGAPRFSGTAIEVAVAHRDRPLPPLPASVPAAVAGFVERLTAKDPAVRPASAAEVAASAAQLRD